MPRRRKNAEFVGAIAKYGFPSNLEEKLCLLKPKTARTLYEPYQGLAPQVGWRLVSSGNIFLIFPLTFADFNECEYRCGPNGKCYNNPGSYSCTCYDGFELDKDSLNCTGK